MASALWAGIAAATSNRAARISSVSRFWSSTCGPVDQYLRGWERRLGIGLEFKAKAGYAKVLAGAVAATAPAQLVIRSVVAGLDARAMAQIPGVKIIRPRGDGFEIETPRYDLFTGILAKIAKRGGAIREIAGNDEIMVSVTVPAGAGEPLQHASLILRMKRDGIPGDRLLVNVRMADLAAFLNAYPRRDPGLEHVFDYWSRDWRLIGWPRSLETVPRYHFNEFVLSPRRRLLLRGGSEQPLIPRYFDLLVFLVEHRHEAVHRRDIFDRVWRDVTVSDSALSQAIRTIRRVLDDDPRDPRFIRTVSRHGYRFVFSDVREEQEDDGGGWPPVRTEAAAGAESGIALGAPSSALAASHTAPVARHEVDTVSSAEQPPATEHARGWSDAANGGAIAGIVAGGLGGLILAAAPGSGAPLALAPVLAVIGGGCGALGGAGVGAGVSLAERVASSRRLVKLTIAAALGGGAVGVSVQWLTRWALAALVGLDVAVGGGAEGLAIGAGAGLGLALATRRMPDGSCAARQGNRVHAALLVALCCGLAGLALALAERPLASATIHAIAVAADGSRATLAPLARLMGEPDFGPVSSAILAFGEAAVFGAGLTFGLVRRRD